MKWIILVLGISSNATASVLIKMSMLPPRKLPSLDDPLMALSNWPFFIGLFFYVFAFILYTAALTHFPLNVAHPILTSGAIATVAIASILIFGEPFYWTTGIGIMLVIMGVALITSRIV